MISLKYKGTSYSVHQSHGTNEWVLNGVSFKSMDDLVSVIMNDSDSPVTQPPYFCKQDS